MPQIPIINDGKSPKKVAGRTIMPGATAYFEESTLPPHLRPGSERVEAAQLENPLKTLLENSIKDVIPQLQALSDDQLSELEQLEVAGDDRSGISKAIQEERLRRADLLLSENETEQDSDTDSNEAESAGEQDGDADSVEDESTGEKADVTE